MNNFTTKTQRAQKKKMKPPITPMDTDKKKEYFTTETQRTQRRKIKTGMTALKVPYPLLYSKLWGGVPVFPAGWFLISLFLLAVETQHFASNSSTECDSSSPF